MNEALPGGAVVATLWDVDDDATAALVADFSARARAGAAFADALDEARRAILAADGRRHPA